MKDGCEETYRITLKHMDYEHTFTSPEISSSDEVNKWLRFFEDAVFDWDFTERIGYDYEVINQKGEFVW